MYYNTLADDDVATNLDGNCDIGDAMDGQFVVSLLPACLPVSSLPSFGAPYIVDET
jgi:hypothetical protein